MEREMDVWEDGDKVVMGSDRRMQLMRREIELWTFCFSKQGRGKGEELVEKRHRRIGKQVVGIEVVFGI